MLSAVFLITQNNATPLLHIILYNSMSAESLPATFPVLFPFCSQVLLPFCCFGFFVFKLFKGFIAFILLVWSAKYFISNKKLFCAVSTFLAVICFMLNQLFQQQMSNLKVVGVSVYALLYIIQLLYTYVYIYIDTYVCLDVCRKTARHISFTGYKTLPFV